MGTFAKTASWRHFATLLGRPGARRELRHMVKYVVVGGSNVAIDFGLYILLVSVGVWYPFAKTLSLVAATGNGYTLNRLWTFRAGPHLNPVLARYVATQIACLLGNVALLALLIEVLGLGDIAAQAMAVPVIAISGFLAQRFWTFDYAVR